MVEQSTRIYWLATLFWLCVGGVFFLFRASLDSVIYALGILLAAFAFCCTVGVIAGRKKKEKSRGFVFRVIFGLLCLFGGIAVVVVRDLVAATALKVLGFLILADGIGPFREIVLSKESKSGGRGAALVLSVLCTCAGYFVFENTFDDFETCAIWMVAAAGVDAMTQFVLAVYTGAKNKQYAKEREEERAKLISQYGRQEPPKRHSFFGRK